MTTILVRGNRRSEGLPCAAQSERVQVIPDTQLAPAQQPLRRTATPSLTLQTNNKREASSCFCVTRSASTSNFHAAHQFGFPSSQPVGRQCVLPGHGASSWNFPSRMRWCCCFVRPRLPDSRTRCRPCAAVDARVRRLSRRLSQTVSGPSGGETRAHSRVRPNGVGGESSWIELSRAALRF